MLLYCIVVGLTVNRLLIIALDGLEPSLVTETMPHLLQQEHGIIEIDVYPLQTPVIWATFLTGTQDNGVPTVPAPHRFHETISRVVGYDRVARISRLAAESGFYKLKPFEKYMRQYTRDDLTCPTIFDLVNHPVALNIPSYNENPEYVDIRRRIAFAITGEYPEMDLVSKSWGLFHDEFDACLDRLATEWELFMVHFFITDLIGHVCWGNIERLKACYRYVDEKVGQLQRRAGEAMVWIVSDHGMQKGLHTHQGFFSTNHPLGIRTLKLTEVYDLIRRVLT